MNKHTRELFQQKLKYFFSLFYLFIPSFAFALGGDSPVNGGLSAIVDQLVGPTGITIATLALIGVGLWCKFGKGDWHVSFLNTVIGIAFVFGAPKLVTLFVQAVS